MFKLLAYSNIQIGLQHLVPFLKGTQIDLGILFIWPKEWDYMEKSSKSASRGSSWAVYCAHESGLLSVHKGWEILKNSLSYVTRTF